LLELLKQIAPGVTRAAILRVISAWLPGAGSWGAIPSAASQVGITECTQAVNVRLSATLLSHQRNIAARRSG
jgi:hypothetical protein